VILLLLAAAAANAAETVSIPFRAVVGSEELACGRKYAGVGLSKSVITPRDFRFYIHNVRLLDEAGKEWPVDLAQDGKWVLDDVALLDFEDGSAGCRNGSPETNRVVTGTVPAGHVYRGLRFTLGVPFAKNHSDLMAMPSPLNLTAMGWVWNAGRRFARIELATATRAFSIHLGSTGCTPDAPNSPPAKCVSPNRAEVELKDFEPGRSVVQADLGALLRDSDVERGGACESDPATAACAPLFAHFGLPFAGHAAGAQDFFRVGLP